MSVETHDLILGAEFLGEGFIAGCSCCWESSLYFETRDEAREAWSNHCERVFMEATS